MQIRRTGECIPSTEYTRPRRLPRPTSDESDASSQSYGDILQNGGHTSRHMRFVSPLASLPAFPHPDFFISVSLPFNILSLSLKMCTSARTEQRTLYQDEERPQHCRSQPIQTRAQHAWSQEQGPAATIEDFHGMSTKANLELGSRHDARNLSCVGFRCESSSFPSLFFSFSPFSPSVLEYDADTSHCSIPFTYTQGSRAPQRFHPHRW